MERKSVTVEVAGVTIEIKELCNKDLFTFLEKFGKVLTDGITLPVFPSVVREIIPTCFSISLKEFEELPASAMLVIFKAFAEVNKSFFETFQVLAKPEKIIKEIVNESPESLENKKS